MLNFNLIYNLEAVAARLKKFMGLALVYFQKYWLLNEIDLLVYNCYFATFLLPPLPQMQNEGC